MHFQFALLVIELNIKKINIKRVKGGDEIELRHSFPKRHTVQSPSDVIGKNIIQQKKA